MDLGWVINHFGTFKSLVSFPLKHIKPYLNILNILTPFKTSMATYRFDDMAQAPIFVSAEDGGSQKGLWNFLGFPNGWILKIPRM